MALQCKRSKFKCAAYYFGTLAFCMLGAWTGAGPYNMSDAGLSFALPTAASCVSVALPSALMCTGVLFAQLHHALQSQLLK